MIIYMSDDMTLGKKKKILEEYKERNDSIKVCVTDHLVDKILKGEHAYTDKIYCESFQTLKKTLKRSVLNGEIYLPKGSGANKVDLRYGSVCFPFDLKETKKEQSRYHELLLITAIRNPYQDGEKLMNSPFEKAEIQFSKKQVEMFKR